MIRNSKFDPALSMNEIWEKHSIEEIYQDFEDFEQSLPPSIPNEHNYEEGIYYGIVNESINAFTGGKKFEKGEKVKINFDPYLHQIVSPNDDQKVGYAKNFEVTILEPWIDHSALPPCSDLSN